MLKFPPKKLEGKSKHEYKRRMEQEGPRASPVSGPMLGRVFPHREIVSGKKRSLAFSREGIQAADASRSESWGEDAAMGAVSPAVVSALVDPLAIYTFKITTFAGFSSSAGGTLYGYISFNPSGVSEYTTLSALFDLVRIKECKLTLTNANPHSDGYAVGNVKTVCYVACDSAKTATTPTSIQTVVDCPNLLAMPLGSDAAHVITYKAPKDLNWADTAAPIPGPYAGCYGQWMLASSSLTVSVPYLNYVSEIVYEFTSRT